MGQLKSGEMHRLKNASCERALDGTALGLQPIAKNAGIQALI